MDDSNRPSRADDENAPSAESQREERSLRRTRERRRRRQPPAAVKRNYLFHVLFYDRAFRWLAVVGVLVFGALGVMWPRIFRTSPDDVFPVIRVSGIDLLKARSLKKTALASEAANKPEEAIQAWIAAIASNEGDVEVNRGLLRNLAGQAKPDLTWLPVVARRADWLLQLTATNQADLELGARVNAAYGQWEWIIYRLSATNAPRTEVTTPLLLAALFEKGLVQRFATEWEAQRAQVATNPRTKLYAAAWAAGWGPGADYLSSLEALEAATKDPELQALAFRLLMRVDYQRFDATAYEQHFNRLRELGADRVNHHVRFWNLLWLSGQRPRAIELAADFGDAPATIEEAELYLGTLATLKQNRVLTDFARQRLTRFTAAPVVWIRAAEALMQVAEWDELRSLAVEMRQHDRLNSALANFSWFFDGVAEHSLGRKPRAEDAFDKFLQKPAPDPQLNFAAAVTINRLGYPEFATRMLRTLETSAGNSSEFWRQMQQAAYESRQVDVLIEASRRLYLLQATDPVVANNYAASLLLRGDRGAEAVKVTLEVLDRMPNSVSARVNRALSLLQIGRIDEVGPLLDSLAGTKIDAATTAVLEFTRFQFHEAKGDKAAALAAAARVEQRFLFPAQVEQFNTSLVKLKSGQ